MRITNHVIGIQLELLNKHKESLQLEQGEYITADNFNNIFIKTAIGEPILKHCNSKREVFLFLSGMNQAISMMKLERVK